MFGYSTTTTTINYTHCCKFYSEEDKHIAVNRLSIAEAGIYSKEHNNPPLKTPEMLNTCDLPKTFFEAFTKENLQNYQRKP